MNLLAAGALTWVMTDETPNPKLAEDLRTLVETPFKVPESVDRAILDQARRVDPVRRSALRPILAAAAAVGLAAIGWVAFVPRPAAHGPAAAERTIESFASPQPARVTILDAFALARVLNDPTARATRDVNGDGVVDRADVDALAMQAVSLNTEAG